MSQRSYQQQSRQRESSSQSSSIVPQGSNANRLSRMQAIDELRCWLQDQQQYMMTVPVMMQTVESHWILGEAEKAWQTYNRHGILPELPEKASRLFEEARSDSFLPLELTAELRYFIQLTEPTGGSFGEAASSKVDWNSRLGIPEYRTQSDNLTAPEATCNVTTLAMILERLGFSRSDVLRAIEDRIVHSEDASETEIEQDWIDAALGHLNEAQSHKRSYQRVRGERSVSRNTRRDLAEDFFTKAQLEDLLDLLLNEMGISRFAVMTRPERLLEILSEGRAQPSTETIWNKNWEGLEEKITPCLRNGGAAALSFSHKGSRDGTHIVSIASIDSSGMTIDDPYGQIRSDYNPEEYDDAYWSKDARNRTIQSRGRSSQMNDSDSFDGWGIDWARALPEQERRGEQTYISKEQVQKGFFYVQLFYRGQEEE